MSRMNSTIKLIVIIGNLIFILSSVALGVISSAIITGYFLPLSYPEAQDLARVALLAALIMFLCTLVGCCGVVNQVRRKGCCAGRRASGLHQIVLVALLIISVMHSIKLDNSVTSLEMVLDNISEYPEYDKFERQISNHFNSAYFRDICLNDTSQSWLLQWIEESCPPSMRQQKCELKGLQKFHCDTGCAIEPWNRFLCCPSEPLCYSGYYQKACPYEQCRLPVLQKVVNWMHLLRTCSKGLVFVTFTVLSLTCLLICYNPRDNLEKELIKSGVMTEDEIIKIKRRKADQEHQQQKHDNKLLKKEVREGPRKRHTQTNRVSPTPSYDIGEGWDDYHDYE